MEKELDYQSVPYGYTHCFNQCPKGEKCLRHLVAERSTGQYPTLSVVNPRRVPESDGACSYFRPIGKTRLAWGVKRLLDNVPSKDASSLKNLMISHFGRTVYYRFYRKERSLNQEQQDFIRRIFRQKGIAEEPAFEYYTEEFQW